MKQTLRWLLLLISPLLLTGCPGPEPETPDNPNLDVVENIVGRWLLSTSDSDNWVVYEFTSSSRILAEIMQRDYYETGTGYYSIDGNTVFGRYVTDRNQQYDIDWKVTEIKPFELEVDIYDDNLYTGQARTYRILADESIEVGQTSTPAYEKISANKNVSEFKTLDQSIAKVNSTTGEITGVKEGITFITFSTSHGTAAIKLIVESKVKTFAEQIVGTWVYDVPDDWERFTYTQDSYVSVQWQTKDGLYNLDETGQGRYTINGETVSFTVNSTAGNLNMKFETETITEFDWTYRSIGVGGAVTGKYTVQRILDSKNMSPEETYTPDYQIFTGSLNIHQFKSHNESVAKVNASGMVTAVAKGRTYIDVVTAKGNGVIEIIVDGGAIPIAFEECIGKSPSAIKEILGANPYYEDTEIIYYIDYSSLINMIGVSLDTWSGRAKALTIQYQPNVNTSQVTSILNSTFIPFMGPTTDTYKAYMDTAERADASIGVTWDIPSVTLTYVNLFTDLFTDYSVLIGLTRKQVIEKIGKSPEYATDQSQAFFFDATDVTMVLVSYTDYVVDFNTVQAVMITLKDTMPTEEVSNYLKRKYNYFPEYSSNEELAFISKGNEMAVYYHLKDNTVMYLPFSTRTKAENFADVIREKFKENSKQLNH